MPPHVHSTAETQDQHYIHLPLIQTAFQLPDSTNNVNYASPWQLEKGHVALHLLILSNVVRLPLFPSESRHAPMMTSTAVMSSQLVFPAPITATLPTMLSFPTVWGEPECIREKQGHHGELVGISVDHFLF